MTHVLIPSRSSTIMIICHKMEKEKKKKTSISISGSAFLVQHFPFWFRDTSDGATVQRAKSTALKLRAAGTL